VGLGGGAYRYLPRTQTKPESRTVRSVSRRGHGRARGRPNRHRSTVARSLAVGKITTHPPACAPRRSCTAHRVVAARRARRRLRRSEMPPVDIAAQSRHRSAVARSLAVGQITTHPPWPLQPTGLPAPRSTGTRRAHARAKHRRCCCPWRRAAWRPAVLPSSPEREEHARAVAVSPRTAADENAEQCDCLSGSSGCGGESQFEVSEWLVARVGTCSTAAAGQR
jgi:hypothetical protein